MELRTGQIASYEFQAALKTLSGISFPTFKENLDVARLIKQVKEIVEAFNKTHIGILGSVAKPSPDGTYKIDAAHVPQVRSQIEAAEGVMIELPDLKLKLPAGANLCARDILALEPFLDL